jgi:hypothetical protein
MRPSPDEVIAGVRAILKQDVAAALPAAAQPQLKRVMAVLRNGRWNEAAFDLLRENAEFARLASDCAARLDRENGLPVSFASISATLRTAANYEPPSSFAEANKANRCLRKALAACLEAVRDAPLSGLDDLCNAIGAALLALRAA